jgi:tetrahydromethanopterin S-methyltransferase subunit C
MLNDRLKAALAVRDAYLPLKRGADELAVVAARCVLTMQEQRRAAGFRLGTGADAIADVSRGAALIAQGMAAIAEAHPKLAQLIEDSGLARFYPYQVAYGGDETPPNEPGVAQPNGHLSLVG